MEGSPTPQMGIALATQTSWGSLTTGLVPLVLVLRMMFLVVEAELVVAVAEAARPVSAARVWRIYLATAAPRLDLALLP